MTTVISVLTTSKIGIWNIPQRGQNFINNHYDDQNLDRFNNRNKQINNPDKVNSSFWGIFNQTL